MKKSLLLLITTLMTVPLVTAGMSSVELTWNDAPNNRVRPNLGQNTNIAFTFEPDNEIPDPTATLNAENLSTSSSPAYETIPVNLSDEDQCTFQDEAFDCTVTHQRLTANQDFSLEIRQDEDTTIPLSLTVQTENGPVTHHAETSVTVDEQPPVPTYVGPSRCEDQDTCYVNEDALNYTASFEAGTGPFHQQNVVALANQQGTTTPIRFAQPGACQDATCTTTQSIACGNGNTITYTLNTGGDNPPPTQDDAQHVIQENIETQATCDTQAPNIVEVSVSGANNPVPTINRVLVRINASDDKSEEVVTTAQIGGSNTSKTCSSTPCTVEINPEVSTPSTETLEVTVEDLAGNQQSTTRTVELRNQSNQEPTLYTNLQGTTETNNLNKDLTQIEQRIYFRLQAISQRPNTELINANIESCQAKEPFTATDTRVKSVDRDSNEIFAYTTVQANENTTAIAAANQVELTCTASLQGSTQTTLYSTTQTLNTTMNVNLVPGRRITQNLEEEIDKTRGRIQWYNDKISQVNNVMQSVVGLCRGMRNVETAYGVMSGIGEISANIPLLNPTVSEPMREGVKTRNPVQKLYNDAIVPACKFATCRADFQNKTLNWLRSKLNEAESAIAPEGSTMSNAQETLSQLGGGASTSGGVINPWRSAPVAVAALCPTAIGKHAKTYVQTECSYLNCLDQGVSQFGVSPSTCKAQKQRSQCVHLGESITNIIPVYNVMQANANTLKEVLNDPVAFLGTTAISSYCKASEGNSQAYFACTLGSTGQSIQKLIKGGQQIRQSYQRFGEISKPACEQTIQRSRQSELAWRFRQGRDNQATRSSQLATLERVENYGTEWSLVDLKGSDAKLKISDNSVTTTETETEVELSGDQTFNDLPGQSVTARTMVEQGYLDPKVVKASTELPDVSFDNIPGRSVTENSLIEQGYIDEDAYDSASDPQPKRLSEEDFVVLETISELSPSSSYTPVGDLRYGGESYELRVGSAGQTMIKIGNEYQELDQETLEEQGLSSEEAELLVSTGNQYKLDSEGLEQTQLEFIANREDVSIEEAKEIQAAREEGLNQWNKLYGPEYEAYAKMAEKSSDSGSPTDNKITKEGMQSVTLTDTQAKEIADDLDLEAETTAGLKEKIKNANPEKLQKAKETANKARRQLQQGQEMARSWTTAINQGMEYGKRVLSARAMGLSIWDEWGDNWFGDRIREISDIADWAINPSSKMCGQGVSPFTEQTDQNVAIQNTDGGTNRLGAIVSGIKSTAGDQTTYQIAYKVQPKEQVSFTVNLDGTTDITNNLTNQNTITTSAEDGQPIAKQKKTSITLPVNADTVCLDFNAGQDRLGYLFDTGTLNSQVSFSGSQICQPIRS